MVIVYSIYSEGRRIENRGSGIVVAHRGIRRATGLNTEALITRIRERMGEES